MYVRVCVDLINMFLLNYPSQPCSAATFYTGQVLLCDNVLYLFDLTVLNTVLTTSAAAAATATACALHHAMSRVAREFLARARSAAADPMSKCGVVDQLF